ncbi:hypothetical protein CATYP_01600 [Corynebacterium atypicum]|uniref:DUF4190 domain-containing protein n=1 Tax=Corynebacterium atypicum TaxID=191610 RepID=A0ABN4DB79_9CORY|nr:hypothetical protein [Corynebacterium atypicum]AIG63589.1 hypothetical protein CATYP_01600 [Corynebacterium atypicum]
MSDKDGKGDGQQLTVAELLARSGAQRSSSTPRRRRHRSLEEGGISVAELTGNMPRVRDKPVESRHSAVPIDAPAPAAEPEPRRAEQEWDRPAYRQPTPAPQRAAEPAAEPRRSPGSTALRREDLSDTGTAVFPRVTDPAANEAVVAWDGEDGQAEDDRELAAYLDGRRLEDYWRDDSRAADSEYQDYGYQDPEYQDYDYQDYAAPGGYQQGPDYGEHTQYPEYDEYPEDEVEGDAADYEAEPDDAEEESGGIAGVILLAVIGVVIGAVVFIGFQQLWESGLSRALVGILALAVTGVFVGVAHALRTARDGLSMVLAGVVGLLMTFGPYLPLIF